MNSGSWAVQRTNREKATRGGGKGEPIADFLAGGSEPRMQLADAPSRVGAPQKANPLKWAEMTVNYRRDLIDQTRPDFPTATHSPRVKAGDRVVLRQAFCQLGQERGLAAAPRPVDAKCERRLRFLIQYERRDCCYVDLAV